MRILNADGDAAAGLLERRWFAAIKAARAMEAECDVLREVIREAEGAWWRARGDLARLEAIRDALGEHVSAEGMPEDDGHRGSAAQDPESRPVLMPRRA
jgi:hypothetical protein